MLFLNVESALWLMPVGLGTLLLVQVILQVPELFAGLVGVAHLLIIIIRLVLRLAWRSSVFAFEELQFVVGCTLSNTLTFLSFFQMDSLAQMAASRHNTMIADLIAKNDKLICSTSTFRFPGAADFRYTYHKRACLHFFSSLVYSAP
jgi:hypothetical protein